ncbi:MAG: VWA domain-containing protein [Dethiobacter sp.]|nr:VWA domain-containing protein [Dethiobacter sp.]
MIKANRGEKLSGSSWGADLRRVWLIMLLVYIFVPVNVYASDMTLNILELKTQTFPMIGVAFDLSNQDGHYELRQGQVTVRENGSPVAILDFSDRVEDNVGLALVLSLDISGSMRTGITEALEAATGFLQHLGENDEVALIAFGRGVYLLQDFTTDKSLLAEVLQNEPKLEPTTVFYDSLKEAIVLLSGRDNPYRTIVALTDGEENSSVTTLEEVIGLAQKENVRIFNIGLSTADLDSELLKYISTETGARAVIAPTRHQLGEVYNNVAGMLRRFYSVVYRSRAAAGEEVAISLTVAADRLLFAEEFYQAPLPAALPVQQLPSAAEMPAARPALLLQPLQIVFGVFLGILLIFFLTLVLRRKHRLLSVPDQYLFIQEAIDMALSGDVIVVSPGIYQENLDFNGKNITVRSKEPTNRDLAAQTVINGGGRDSVIKFGERSRAILEGFTITNGAAAQGGGVYIYRHASPTLAYNIISDNKGTQEGGGIYIGLFSSPRVLHNTICRNTSHQGGGVYMGDCSKGFVFKNNINHNYAKCGGGIFVTFGSSPKLKENEISDNRAEQDGGGINIRHQSQAVMLKNRILGNSATSGGGIMLNDWVINSQVQKALKGNNVLDNSPENYIVNI